MILGGDQLSARIDLGLHLLVYILVSQSVIFTHFLIMVLEKKGEYKT